MRKKDHFELSEDATTPKEKSQASGIYEENPPKLSKELGGFRIEFNPLRVKYEVRLRSLQREFGLFFRFYNGEIGPLRHTFEDNGLRETSHGDWTLYWSIGPIKEEIYKQLKGNQKNKECCEVYELVNHFIGAHEITRKDFLHKNLSFMREKFGVKHFNFSPSSWILPLEANKLMKYKEGLTDPKRTYFIVKPAGLCQGKGIYVTNDLNEVLESKSKEPLVVSKYVDKPYLIDGHKFDLRIYVVITSVYPLRIFVYKEGLARFASEKYELSEDKLKNRFIHLTNYTLNKANEKFVDSKEEQNSFSNIKWRLSSLLTYLEKHNIDTIDLQDKLDDILIKTILSIEPLLFENNVEKMPHNDHCFEFLGFDIILDSYLRPWLLEVNLSPSLSCESSLDFDIKSRLIADMLNLVGLFSNQKHQSINPNRGELQEKETEGDPLISVVNAENKRKGNFRRIYPGGDSSKYSRFFQRQRPLNESIVNRYFVFMKSLNNGLAEKDCSNLSKKLTDNKESNIENGT